MAIPQTLTRPICLTQKDDPAPEALESSREDDGAQSTHFLGCEQNVYERQITLTYECNQFATVFQGSQNWLKAQEFLTQKQLDYRRNQQKSCIMVTQVASIEIKYQPPFSGRNRSGSSRASFHFMLQWR